MKFDYLIMVMLILFIPISTGLLKTVSDSKQTEQTISSELVYSSF